MICESSGHGEQGRHSPILWRRCIWDTVKYSPHLYSPVGRRSVGRPTVDFPFMGLLSTLNPVSRARTWSQGRFNERLFSKLSPSARQFFGLAGITRNDLFSKEPRSVLPEAFTRSYAEIIDPPYDPVRLQDVYERQWAVRLCVDKLVRESTRQGWRFDPMFEVACGECEEQFQYVPLSEKCPECGSTNLEYPDEKQLDAVREFLKAPNPTLTTADLLKRFVKDLLLFDDAYISEILPQKGDKNAAAREWWPEDARYISAIADKKGRLGGKRFCPLEEARKDPGAETKLYTDPAGSRCPSGDGGVLAEAGYVQRLGSQTVAAFSPDEIMHTNLFAVGNRLFGTPKIWAIQTQVTAMALIDAYQREAFDKGKTPNSIYLLKGIANDALRRILKQHSEEKRINMTADMWIPVPNWSGGGKGPDVEITRIPGMELPLLDGSIAYSEYYFRSICYTFGVSPTSIGLDTPGRLGASQGGAPQQDVTPESINEIQVQVSESWDAYIKTRWPEVTDWKFSLITAHEAEEKELWAIKLIQMQASKMAVDAGFDVLIDEDGTPKISGQNTMEDRQQRAVDISQSRGTTTATAAEEPSPFEKVQAKSLQPDDTSHGKLISQSQSEYRESIRGFAERLFSALRVDSESVFGYSVSKTETVSMELSEAMIIRTKKILDRLLPEAEQSIIRMARMAYREGSRAGRRRVKKQYDLEIDAELDEPDQAALETLAAQSIESMRNTLYIGDKDSYLAKIKEISRKAAEENWTVERYSNELRSQLDPGREYFSDYMWERVARTEPAIWVTAGRLKAYDNLGLSQVRWVAASDAVDICAENDGQVYDIDEAGGLIPAHPNCRCAWSPA